MFLSLSTILYSHKSLGCILLAIEMGYWEEALGDWWAFRMVATPKEVIAIRSGHLPKTLFDQTETIRLTVTDEHATKLDCLLQWASDSNSRNQKG